MYIVMPCFYQLKVICTIVCVYVKFYCAQAVVTHLNLESSCKAKTEVAPPKEWPTMLALDRSMRPLNCLKS